MADPVKYRRYKLIAVGLSGIAATFLGRDFLTWFNDVLFAVISNMQP